MDKFDKYLELINKALICTDREELTCESYFHIGKNSFGDIVLSALVGMESDVYMNVLVPIDVILNHFKGNISYLSVLKKDTNIYMIECFNIKEVIFDEIPDNILPEKTSFYLLDFPDILREYE